MKLFPLLLIALFVSCRQNHTCECTIKTSYLENKDSIAKVTDRTLIVKNNIRDTKKNAKYLCAATSGSANSVAYSLNGPNVSSTVTSNSCVLK